MNNKYTTMTQGQQGFTLIELVIVMLVVGLLTAVALPSYSEYVLRSSRVEARTVLTEADQFMARFYAANNAYDTKLDGAAVALPAALTQSPREGAARYTVALVGGDLTASSYTLAATPVGPSSVDHCGTMSITSTGQQLASGVTSAADVAKCWR